MILRDFKKGDAQTIAGWIRSEEELYKWSADRFNKYPLSGDDINKNYAPQLENGRFYPLTAVDEDESIIGHFIIRYPRDDDDSSVRFGFVIVNPAMRGKGYGKEMLRLGVGYVKEHLNATRIDLLNRGTFFDATGEKSKVLLLVEGDELISFCTYSEKDDIQPTDLTPWMGFVYTFPEHRGHRYVGMLMTEIERLAGIDGDDEIKMDEEYIKECRL